MDLTQKEKEELRLFLDEKSIYIKEKLEKDGVFSFLEFNTDSSIPQFILDTLCCFNDDTKLYNGEGTQTLEERLMEIDKDLFKPFICCFDKITVWGVNTIYTTPTNQ